jgi:hypothetical protein
MPPLFDFDGDNLDPGFVNLRNPQFRVEQELHEQIEAMWQTYEPYADPDFRPGFARDLDGRFWEMYLGQTLLQTGRTLLPTSERLQEGGQPDLCILENGQRTWIEAIAPDIGEPGPDQVVGPPPLDENGAFAHAPTRQAQLRTTSAFWTKSQRIRGYIREGVINPEDVRIIAISACRFGAYVGEEPPLILSSLFPIGNAYVTINSETGELVEQGHESAPVIERYGGEPIPRIAFLNERFADVSGVLWSRIGVGNLCRGIRPLIYVRNPFAAYPVWTGCWLEPHSRQDAVWGRGGCNDLKHGRIVDRLPWWRAQKLYG